MKASQLSPEGSDYNLLRKTHSIVQVHGKMNTSMEEKWKTGITLNNI